MASAEWNLKESAKGGRVEEVLSLLEDNSGLDVNWKEAAHESTALHWASRWGHAEVVKVLLAHPAISVNVKNNFGETPFIFGCENGHVSVVQLLLKDPRVDVTLADSKGRTPLWWAS